jgi:hypothetical protein
MFRERSDLVRQAENLRRADAETCFAECVVMEFAASLYGFNNKGFRPNRGKADMSGVLLVPVSGEVLGPMNRAMTFQIDVQVHCKGQRGQWRNGTRKKSMRSARWLPGYAFAGCDVRPFIVETQACRPRAFVI